MLKIITHIIKGVLITVLLGVSFSARGQHTFAVRNNLAYDAFLTPNLGAELRVDSLWTLGIHAGFISWDYDSQKNKKWRHLLVAPNFRRYLGDSLFHKGYIEGDLIYSHFNVGNVKFPFGLYESVRDRRLQGDLVAIGGKYGYSWTLARHWRFEAEAGIAVGYAWFKEYDCPTCGTYYGRNNRPFLLPLLGINVVYLIN